MLIVDQQTAMQLSEIRSAVGCWVFSLISSSTDLKSRLSRLASSAKMSSTALSMTDTKEQGQDDKMASASNPLQTLDKETLIALIMLCIERDMVVVEEKETRERREETGVSELDREVAQTVKDGISDEIDNFLWEHDVNLEEVEDLAVENLEKRKEKANLEGRVMKVKDTISELCDDWLDHGEDSNRDAVQVLEGLQKGLADLEKQLKDLQVVAKERANNLGGRQDSW
jgi:hypothetical protein